MAYEEKLAQRIRLTMAGVDGASEKKMFGGLCFLVNGNMACGVVKDELMVRVGPDAYPKLVSKPHAREMDFTGRPLKGMLYVSSSGLKTKASLSKWAGHGVAFASSLEPKKGRGPKAKAPAKKADVTTKRTTTKKKSAAKKSASAAFEGFKKPTFDFLKALDQNNDKKWFDAHREDYQTAYVQPALAFIEAMGPRLKKLSKTINYAPKINGSLFRINRDVRFSKDKTPYKNHIDMWFWEGPDKGWNTPGFFIRLTPSGLILGNGMHRFEKKQLETYRNLVVDGRKGAALQKAIDNVLSAGKYKLGEATRKRVPRGFDPDHGRSALLLQDGLVVTWEGKPPKQARSADFVEWCTDHFKAFMPLHKWLLKNV